MAFLKKCISTISRCSFCGKPGIIEVKGKMYCETCAKIKNKSKIKSKK